MAAALLLGLPVTALPVRAQSPVPPRAAAGGSPPPVDERADARHGCDGIAPGRGWALDTRLDNDLIGGQDEGYTAGIWVAFRSPLYGSLDAMRCLPEPVHAWQHATAALEPDAVDGRQVMFSFGQALWTPGDGQRRDLIVEDRPYAAALVVSLASNARAGDRLHASVLRLGMVGPAVGGRHLQRVIHRITASEQPQGWSNQLRNEPVFQLGHERLRRRTLAVGEGGWGSDMVTRWGGAVGTLATAASTGVEWRAGKGLRDDFGSVPLRPAGEAAAARDAAPRTGWAGHGFVSLDARWLLRDISLDGNTFRDSHSVDRRPFGLTAGYGFAVERGDWRLVIARYHRTREFDGQQRAPVFGSVTVSVRL